MNMITKMKYQQPRNMV